jgi:hypothetical protein
MTPLGMPVASVASVAFTPQRARPQRKEGKNYSYITLAIVEKHVDPLLSLPVDVLFGAQRNTCNTRNRGSVGTLNPTFTLAKHSGPGAP